MDSKGASARVGSRVGARSALVALVAMSAVYTGGVTLMDAMVGGLAGSMASTASLLSMVVAFVLVAALIVCEVRAYRAIVASVPFEPEVGDKILLGLSLWFGGGAPLSAINLARAVMLGGAGDVRQILIQLGLAAAFLILTYPKFRA